MSKHEDPKKYFRPRFHVLINLAFLILSAKIFSTRENASIQDPGKNYSHWNALRVLETLKDFGIDLGWYFHPKSIWNEIFRSPLLWLSSVQSGSVIIPSIHHDITTPEIIFSSSIMYVNALKCTKIICFSLGLIIFLVCVCLQPSSFSARSGSPQSWIIYHWTQNKFLQDTDHN